MAGPGPLHFFAKNANQFKASDLATADLYMSLHTSTWTPNITATGNSVFADATNELTTANGYTAGGYNVTGEAVAADAANDGYKVSTGNATWTASGAGLTFRYAVIYVNTNPYWGLNKPLIGYILLDTAPADIVVAAGNTVQINCPADGWGKITSS